jgi:acid phosphatase
MRSFRLFACALSLAFVSCAGPLEGAGEERLEAVDAGEVAREGQPASRSAPIGNDVRWVERSAEYLAAARQAFAVATVRLDALADAGALDGSDWAVSLDVDETTLSNVTYQRERTELGLGFTPATWTHWVARREATALPGARAFLDRVRALGGRIALVTNRRAHECPDTEANLVAEDLPYDVILCRTGTGDKSERFRSLEDGTAARAVPPLRLVLFVGDNIQDFPGMSQSVRFMPEEALAEFTSRFVLVPNPMYGSWEDDD